MTLVKRRLSAQIQLGNGTSFAAGGDAVTLTGMRMSANVTKAGGATQNELTLRIFGLALDVANKLTILGKPVLDGKFNRIILEAGDEGGAMAVVFAGVIQEAWVNGQSAPDVSFDLVAATGYLEALKPIDPSSYQGTVDAARVMAGLAAQMEGSFQLENSGVQLQISNPYLYGTLRQQMDELAAYGFNYTIDDVKSVVAIWPKGGSRGDAIPKISPETGLVGYPVHTEQGIQLTTLFNPNIQFGGFVQVESSLQPVNGKWHVFNVTHSLDSETPDGKWFTEIECGTEASEASGAAIG